MSERKNINYLLTLLKARLNSSGKNSKKDDLGNIIYVDCDIFSNEVLVNFLGLSLSEFNQCPQFTNYSFEDDKFVKTFSAILVEGATVYALSSKALIERGREFKMEQDGIWFDPPAMADLLNTQYVTTLQDFSNKLIAIKNNIDKYDGKSN